MAIETQSESFIAEKVYENIFTHFPKTQCYSIGMRKIIDTVDQIASSSKFFGFVETLSIQAIKRAVNPYTKPPHLLAPETTLNSADPNQVDNNSQPRIWRNALGAGRFLSRVPNLLSQF